MKRNILFVVDERRIGGVSILLDSMLKMINLKKYNIDVLVLANHGEMLNNLPKEVNLINGTPYFSSVDYSLKEVIKSKNIKKIFHKIRLILDMKTGFIKKRIIKERKKILSHEYDVEIAFKDGFTAIFTAYGNSKNKIHWLHYEYVLVNPNGNYQKLFNKILPMFDKIVAVSQQVKQAFNNIYHLDDKTLVIDNLVNTDIIKSKSLENTDVSLDKNDLNIVCVGRLHYQKGYPRMIDVFGRLKKEGKLPSNIKVRIYGNGDQYNIIKDKIDKFNLNSQIFMMGSVLNPYKYIKNNDLFILPSLYEPFGLVIVESMCLQVPVLACRNAATDKLIKHNYNGFIVENNNEELYNGILYLINNKNKIKTFKKNLFNYEYNNTTIIKEIEGILDYDKNKRDIKK